MTKVKAEKEDSKDGLRHLKHGSVNKKKQQKFKNTPVGKVALINGSQNKSNGKSTSENNAKNIHNSSRIKKSPKGSFTKNSSASLENSKSPSPKKVKVKLELTEENETDSDSDDDINEGISINEEVSAHEDEEDDDDSSDDGAMPDIFGQSLAEETDEDDDEFDADTSEDKNESLEKKGVKMFKGLTKVKAEPEQSLTEESSNNDDDDEEDDDDSDDKDKPDLSTLLGNTLVDEEDDEDFEGDEDDDDDDDEDMEDDESDQLVNTSSSNVSTDRDEDDEDEDEDEDDSDDDDDKSSLGLKDLLGNSIVDDEDDEDFEGEDDDDSSDENDTDLKVPSLSTRSKLPKVELKSEDELNESKDSIATETSVAGSEKATSPSKDERKEKNERTIFVGNIPKDITVSRLKSEFKKFGSIESVRIRGIIPENEKIPLKVAAITKKFHPKMTTICAFVIFKTKDSVAKALSMNGKKLDGNYLRVDCIKSNKSASDEIVDKKKAVFLGNIPFTIEDNDIWDAFKKCGKIESVRIIRDRKTGLGRGFGFINFESTDGAVLALDLNGTELKGRELRVSVNHPHVKKAKKGTKRPSSGGAENGSPKKRKTEDSESVEVATRNSVNAQKRTDKKKRSQGEKQRVKSESSSPQGKFQGQKADAKKKPKQNKSDKKKKVMAAKLLAKTKKPASN